MRTLLLALLTAVLPLAAQADTLRCGANLASDGMTKAEVLQRCGPPADRSTRYEAVSESSGTQGARTTVTATRAIEEWTYNFGPTEFMRLATFVDGKLVSVRALGYGH